MMTLNGDDPVAISVSGALVGRAVGFSAGAGPEVRGEAEALLMAIAGRRSVVGELAGPGHGKLAGRIGG